MAFMGIGEVTFNPFSPKQLFMGKKGRWTKARLSAPEDYEGPKGGEQKEGGREGIAIVLGNRSTLFRFGGSDRRFPGKGREFVVRRRPSSPLLYTHFLPPPPRPWIGYGGSQTGSAAEEGKG